MANFIGFDGLEHMKTSNERLSFQVLDQVNDSQALVLVNKFAREVNEFQYKSEVQERISDINSWRWVLEDLSNRLTEAISALQYEHKAMRVVVGRLKNEIAEFSRENSRPGALAPDVDIVENAIHQEHKFLKDQKKTFELMIPALEKHMAAVERTKKRVEDDVLKKSEAVNVEESCATIDPKSLEDKRLGPRKKKKICPISRWDTRCAALKREGLNALATAVVVRQQARGARVQLSAASQTYSSRVDVTLRKRLHHNTFKLSELDWQRDETARDLASLWSEQMCTEKSLLANLERERVVEARLVDRTNRPQGEHTRDGVDRKLRDELASTRCFIKSLRANLDQITKLQNSLSANMARIDCCGQDLLAVIRLDQERLSARLGEDHAVTPTPLSSNTTFTSASNCCPSQRNVRGLDTIREETEEEEESCACVDVDENIDDYPFDY